MQLEKVDDMVAEFEDGLNDKLENLSKKHTSETFELFRIKKSFQRLLKRNQQTTQMRDQPKIDDFFNIEKTSIGDSTA